MPLGDLTSPTSNENVPSLHTYRWARAIPMSMRFMPVSIIFVTLFLRKTSYPSPSLLKYQGWLFTADGANLAGSRRSSGLSHMSDSGRRLEDLSIGPNGSEGRPIAMVMAHPLPLNVFSIGLTIPNQQLPYPVDWSSRSSCCPTNPTLARDSGSSSE